MKHSAQKKTKAEAPKTIWQKLTSLLFDTSDDNVKPVPMLSQEGIKLVFEIVKNYAIVLVVGLGAVAFSESEIVKQRDQLGPWLSPAIVAAKWLLLCLPAVLALLNGLYTTYVFELTPFYRSRRRGLGWAFGSIILSTLLGAFILLAIYLAKVKGVP